MQNLIIKANCTYETQHIETNMFACAFMTDYIPFYMLTACSLSSFTYLHTCQFPFTGT